MAFNSVLGCAMVTNIIYRLISLPSLVGRGFFCLNKAFLVIVYIYDIFIRYKYKYHNEYIQQHSQT